ncbi:MAG TPA: sigma-70 family RNA polymerase sigma factor [Polyangiaceae bacterium]|nr:sigma-70 family RNA polymerase sigma factor [Polyangiaceae bacterium]
MTSDLTLPLDAAARVQDAQVELERDEAANIFDQHCDYVWNTLRRLGVAFADREDLTHDTFVAVFRHWQSYDAERPLRPWLFGFALRVASDHRRRARHRWEVSSDVLDPPDETPGAVELLLQKERAALAQQALQSIELSRCAVFILHEIDGATLPEIAAVLEIPLGTASSRLRLARQDFAVSVRRLSSRNR